jgi:hypothetical protein
LFGELVESLGDDVTQLHFHPSIHNYLASGSTDGLACVFDIAQLHDEDDALISVINSGSSVHKISFCGTKYESLVILTHIETMGIWGIEDVSILKTFIMGFPFCIHGNYLLSINNSNTRISLCN